MSEDDETRGPIEVKYTETTNRQWETPDVGGRAYIVVEQEPGDSFKVSVDYEEYFYVDIQTIADVHTVFGDILHRTSEKKAKEAKGV